MQTVTVVLVMDPTYGSRLVDALKLGPVWGVKSDANAAFAKKLWAEAGADCALTIFDALDGFSPEVAVIDVLASISEHHPLWTQVDVRGVALTVELTEALAAEGYGLPASTGSGFILPRAPRRSR